MASPVPRRLAKKIDGAALFTTATSVSGLMAGWRRVAENQGAAGGDGIDLERFANGLEQRLIHLSADLAAGRYRPGPIRHVEIAKKSGGKRRLSIPTIADRVAQSAVAQALTPLLEAEFEDASHGYRPGRGVATAVAQVEALRRQGYTWTLDADINDFFDSVPIDKMAERFAASVTEGPLVELVSLWLEHGSTAGRGLPQGSPLSPLLANLYLDGIDEAMSTKGVRIVRYADDFLVMAKDRPASEAAARRVAAELNVLGLALDPAKTKVRDYDQTLRFLGHVFVRGFALPSPGEEADPTAHALQAVAEADRVAATRALAEANAGAAEADAGLDRGLRLLHVRGKGRRLALRNQSFAVLAAPDESPPGERRELLAVHPSRVDRVELGPSVDADLDTLKHALAQAVPVALVDGHGRTLGQMAPALSQRADRHLAQARLVLDPARRIALARILVSGRILNQRSFLRRVNHRRGLGSVDVACAAFGGFERRARLKPGLDLDALRGYEGAATKVFWRSWSALLLHGFTLPHRQRRRGADPVNIMLDMAAGLLTRDMGAIVSSVGLHPGFGVLHESAGWRDACVYDLVEEFRTGLVESIVFQAINIRTIDADGFSRTEDGAWRMNRETGDAIIRAYEERAERPVLDKRTGKRASWRRLMRLQAERYAAHCEEREVYVPYVLDN
jgi:CRISPR-associated protein Cas1